MTGLRLAVAIGVLSLATGCCSTDQRWGQMAGYENIGNSSRAPRDGVFGLWRLAGIRRAGLCVYRDGPDVLVITAFVRKGEELGIRKPEGRIEAYAGAQILPLSPGDYMWRLEIMDDDRKRIARDEFLWGTFEVIGGFLGEIGKGTFFRK